MNSNLGSMNLGTDCNKTNYQFCVHDIRLDLFHYRSEVWDQQNRLSSAVNEIIIDHNTPKNFIFFIRCIVKKLHTDISQVKSGRHLGKRVHLSAKWIVLFHLALIAVTLSLVLTLFQKVLLAFLLVEIQNNSAFRILWRQVILKIPRNGIICG